jgi:hypothetical protein
MAYAEQLQQQVRALHEHSRHVCNALVEVLPDKKVREVIMSVCSNDKDKYGIDEIANDTGMDTKKVDEIVSNLTNGKIGYVPEDLNLIGYHDREKQKLVPNPRLKLIRGRPIDLTERAPSFSNKHLAEAAWEYHPYQTVPQIQYLISPESPIEEIFWKQANYSDLDFQYKGKTVKLFTNHGSEYSMRDVIGGKLDISDLVLDLSWLSGQSFRKDGAYDRKTHKAFKDEVQEQVKNGMKKLLVKFQPQ